MKYVTAEDILVIHARVIEETGGIHGVRDTGLLISLIERPKTRIGGEEAWKDIFQKAAVYLDSFVRYHIFVDGNKRAGIVVAARFLFMNGFELTASNRELEAFVLRVATEKPEIEQITTWLKKHSIKISKRS